MTTLSPGVYRLVMLKHALRLEQRTGLRHSGGSIRARIAAEFGLKPRDSRELFIDAIQRKLDQIAHEAHKGSSC
jgi:hypothetical protein